MSTTVVSGTLAFPPSEVGPALLALPEDQYFERKALNVSPERLANLEVGFANADGGVAVIGLRDGRVEGTNRDPKRVNALVQAAFDLTTPVVPQRVERVPCVNDDGEEDVLLVIWVDSSRQVHANHREEVYLRVGDETRRLTFDQRRNLLFDKGQAAFEAEPVPTTTIEDGDTVAAAAYAEAIGAPDVRQMLVARGFVAGDALTVAGTLLFADYPQRWLPQAFVRVIRYRGTVRGAGSRQQKTHDLRCEGPLAGLLKQARDAVAEWQPTRTALARSGRFEPTPLIPEDAWLEAIVNAVVHRSYNVSGDHIRVEIFDDRIEVNSPGRFPGLVRLDDPLKTVRFARNPYIARVVHDLDFGQEMGEGIRRMFEEMRSAGLTDPLYHQTSGSVSVALSTALADRKLDADLLAESRAVVGALREAERLSTGEIAEILRMSRPPVLRRLAELEKAGIIEWVGKSARDPRAYWRLPR